MLTIRHIYDAKQKNYLKNLYEQYGTIPEDHMKAIKLRQEFFNKFIIERVIIFYYYCANKIRLNSCFIRIIKLNLLFI